LGSNPCMGKKNFFSPYPPSHLSIGTGSVPREKSARVLTLTTHPFWRRD
jgi:hypothetical protein